MIRGSGRAMLASASRWRPSARSADHLLVLGLLAWALFDVPWWWRPPGHSGPALAILGTVALAAAQSVPFRWRRRQPVPVLALAGACLAVKYAAGLNLWSAGVAVLVAGYGLGACGGRPVRQAARVLAVAALLGAVVALQAENGNHGLAVACALLAAALVLGEVASAHRDVATAAARHAQDRERASIAREVHDVVAHQLSAIAVQAGAARLASAGDPEIAAAAVAAIEQEARRGLVELNHLVGVLRQRSAEPSGQPSEVSSEMPAQMPPEARLGSIRALVERAKGAGVAVSFVVEGEPRPLPAAVELAGYRVVQESLTNAIRHARGSSARVRLGYLDGGIVIEVADDGPSAHGSPPPAAAGLRAPPPGAGLLASPAALGGQGHGFGLTGLSERARLLGGEFEAGRGADHGFVVRAYLPDAP